MRRSKGFTLIELLTVIAIIAILTAIILPVLARAKDAAYRSTDLNHLNEISAALHLYRVDNGAFPPGILGYASVYMSGPLMGQVIPAASYSGHLYSKRIPSLDTIRPAYNRYEHHLVTKAYWPNADPRPVGTAPILDLNGDGIIDPTDDLPNARQMFGVGAIVLAESPLDNSPCDGGGPSTHACFYRISGFDVGEVPDPTNPSNMIFELRYTRFWTVWGMTGGNALDDPRQLGYEDPPESTVITWNSWFREYDGGSAAPRRLRRDQVLFLRGNARPFDSKDLYDRSWRVMP